MGISLVVTDKNDKLIVVPEISQKRNELFFKDGANMEVNVIYENLSKEEAMEKEKDFIAAYEPEYNIHHNPRNRKVKTFRKYTI